jgi:hypothetical protein
MSSEMLKNELLLLVGTLNGQAMEKENIDFLILDAQNLNYSLASREGEYFLSELTSLYFLLLLICSRLLQPLTRFQPGILEVINLCWEMESVSRRVNQVISYLTAPPSTASTNLNPLASALA